MGLTAAAQRTLCVDGPLEVLCRKSSRKNEPYMAERMNSLIDKRIMTPEWSGVLWRGFTGSIGAIPDSHLDQAPAFRRRKGISPLIERESGTCLTETGESRPYGLRGTKPPR